MLDHTTPGRNRRHRQQRWRIAISMGLLLIGLTSMVLAGCSSRTVEQTGSGWPNIALSQKTVMNEGSSLSATPVAIGPNGAEFEVEVDLDDALSHATLQIDDATWPLEGWVEARDNGSDRRTYLLRFTSGGPPVGEVKLSVHAGPAFVFTWRI